MENNNFKKYIESKTTPFFDMQIEMEKYAQEYNIPIVSRDSLDLLISIVKIRKPKAILEFGTAIGYSTIAMASQSDIDTQIISFERDPVRYEEALKNIKKMGMEDRITVYNVDPLVDSSMLSNQKFDLVFVDAAKGQYRAFFDLIFDNVFPYGIIISDNIFHKGMVIQEDISLIEKRYRTIYKRMKDYLIFLKHENKNFFTTLVPIGDGIAITYKYGKDF